jgi:hypothetical protein
MPAWRRTVESGWPKWSLLGKRRRPPVKPQAFALAPAAKGRDRFEQEGLAGLQDRSSRPHRLRKPTPPEVIERIESLRRQRMPGKEIATALANLVRQRAGKRSRADRHYRPRRC